MAFSFVLLISILVFVALEFFSDDGSIETLTLLNGNDESDLILIFKEGKAASFHEKRIDSKGKACQFSIVYYPNKGRMERFYELPSQTKWVKWYDLSNKIIKKI